MKKLIHIIIVCMCMTLAVSACRDHRHSNTELIRLADEQVYRNVDSIKTLLEKVHRPLELKGKERLLYGWLMGYMHFHKGASMVEDSLVALAADAYIASEDTTRKLMSYQLKGDYLKWQGKPHEALEVLNEGTRLAEQMKDTLWIKELQVCAGRIYCFVLKDYTSCTNIFRRLVTLTDDPMTCYSLGLSMAFEELDSFPYYMSKAADLSLQQKDTTQAVFILRNMVSASTQTAQSKKFIIETIRRILALEKGIRSDHKLNELETRNSTLRFSYVSAIDGFLHLKQLDSAQYYIDQFWELYKEDPYLHWTSMNALSTYQALVDYINKGTFDISKAFHFFDSIYRKNADNRNTFRQINSSHKQLTADALELIVERQKTQLSLMLVLVVAMGLAIGIIVVVWLYRRKLQHAKKQVRAYILLQQENEKQIGHNERIIRELQHQMAIEGEQANELLDEQKHALEMLQKQTEELRNENRGLQERIEKYKHQPSEEEIAKLKASANRMHELEERERELTAELANNNELMRKLRENPKFLGAAEWKKLEGITNRIYNLFTERLKAEYGHLTEVDIQLCILLKLRFTVSQISILTATASSSVSVQKNRLKKRLLQKDEHLFDDGKTLDMYLWMY